MNKNIKKMNKNMKKNKEVVLRSIQRIKKIFINN